MIRYVVERELKFKTVPNRWEPTSTHDTLHEAEDRLASAYRCAEDHGFGRSKGGGEIVAYRVTEYESMIG
jgi:hypothetical protein